MAVPSVVTSRVTSPGRDSTTATGIRPSLSQTAVPAEAKRTSRSKTEIVTVSAVVPSLSTA